jgi:hypothetical protein
MSKLTDFDRAERDRLDTAISNARRFIERAEARVLEHDEAVKTDRWVPTPSKARASALRASLDLTVSLADLRRRP